MKNTKPSLAVFGRVMQALPKPVLARLSRVSDTNVNKLLNVIDRPEASDDLVDATNARLLALLDRIKLLSLEHAIKHYEQKWLGTTGIVFTSIPFEPTFSMPYLPECKLNKDSRVMLFLRGDSTNPKAAFPAIELGEYPKLFARDAEITPEAIAQVAKVVAQYVRDYLPKQPAKNRLLSGSLEQHVVDTLKQLGVKQAREGLLDDASIMGLHHLLGNTINHDSKPKSLLIVDIIIRRLEAIMLSRNFALHDRIGYFYNTIAAMHLDKSGLLGVMATTEHLTQTIAMFMWYVEQRMDSDAFPTCEDHIEHLLDTRPKTPRALRDQLTAYRIGLNTTITDLADQAETRATMQIFINP